MAQSTCEAFYQAMRSSQSTLGAAGGNLVLFGRPVAIGRARPRSYTAIDALLERTSFLAIRGCNRQSVILHWNAASTVLYGLDAAEAVGKRLEDLLLTGDAVREFEEVVARIWQTGVPIAFKGPVNLQYGRRLWVCSTMVPAFYNGEVCEVFCIDVDITEHRQVNGAPRKSEERPGRIVPVAHEGAWGGDIVGHMTRQSARCKVMLGHADDERSEDSREAWNRINPDHTERMKAQLWTHLLGQADYFASEHRLRCKEDTCAGSSRLGSRC